MPSAGSSPAASASDTLWHSHYSLVVASLQQLIYSTSIIMLIRIACLAVPCSALLQLARELSACPSNDLGHGWAMACRSYRAPPRTQADSVVALSQTRAAAARSPLAAFGALWPPLAPFAELPLGSPAVQQLWGSGPSLELSWVCESLEESPLLPSC